MCLMLNSLYIRIFFQFNIKYNLYSILILNVEIFRSFFSHPILRSFLLVYSFVSFENISEDNTLDVLRQIYVLHKQLFFPFFCLLFFIIMLASKHKLY